MQEEDADFEERPPVMFEQQAPSDKEEFRPHITIPEVFAQSGVQVDQASIECLEFLSDGTFLAAGLSSGAVKVVSAGQGVTQYVLKGSDPSPVTGLAHNPSSNTVRHAVLATHSEGTLQYWHATSSQLLFSKKFDEMLQTCEISPEGTRYAFAGDNGRIRVGSLTKEEPEEMMVGHLGSHDNRVFCLKWHPSESSWLLSGGWDRAVHLWDIRSKASARKLFGYYMGGEAIDFRGDEMLLGNNQPQNQLRIYDFRADKVRALSWKVTEERQMHYTTGVLSCFYGRDNEIVACSPKNEVRLFRGEEGAGEYRCRQEGRKLYCMQRWGRENRVATGWSDGCVRWLSYPE